VEGEAVAALGGLNPSVFLKRVLNTKFQNPFAKQNAYLVLDIGSSSIKLAEVQHGSAPRLTALAVAPIPASLLEDGEDVTLAGTSDLRFDAAGLVTEQWDAWNVVPKRRDPPAIGTPFGA
jgi:hypothetical protein